MPGFRAHYIFGKNAYENSGIIAEFSPIKSYPMSYGLGLQGPDFFFYDPLAHLFNRPDIGTQMHHANVMSVFSSLLSHRQKLASSTDRRIADAYIAGFMAHYTLDTICHPYVHYRAKKMAHLNEFTYSFGIHVLLETDIDNTLLRHYMHTKPSQFRTENTIALSPREKLVISNLLAHALKEAFPEARICASQIRQSMRMVWFINRHMSDPHALKKKAVRLIDQMLFGHAFVSAIMSVDNQSTYTDPCNLRHRLWRNPWQPDITSNEDFFELMARAQDLFEERIRLYKLLISAPIRSRIAATIDRIRHDKGKEPHAIISHEASKENYYHNLNTLLENLGDLSYDSGLPLEDQAQ